MIFDRNRYGLDNDIAERGPRSLTNVPVDKQTTWLVTKLDFTTGEEYLWGIPRRTSNRILPMPRLICR